MSGEANLVITRLYRESSEVDSCVEAVRLLLNFRESKEKGGPTTARDAAKESENGCDAEIIIP